MARADNLATQRLELISKGIDLPPIQQDLDPALRIPRSRFRADAWENLSTGFGNSAQHPTNASLYTGIPKVSERQQEDLYRSDWVARKAMDAPAEDMTRKGISYQHNDDDEEDGKKNNGKSESQKKVEDFNDLLEDKYSLWRTAFQAVALARVSGGSLTLFNYDDIQTAEEFAFPLNENRVSEIRWVKTIPAWFAIPITWYRDINHPKYDEPEHYQIVIRGVGGGITLNVHESRMIRMDGRFTTQTARVQNRGWNDSEIQAVYTALRDYGICVTESNSTMETFTQDYLGMKGLAEKAMLGSDPDYILERVAMTHFNMTSNRLNVFDADSETMERKGTPITGLADLWDRYTEAICGASSIPRPRFFSTQSGALGGNGTAEDMETYYDGIGSKQELQLRPWLNQYMFNVNMAENMVTELPSYTFNELQAQTDKEKAETRFTQAQTDQIYIQENVLSPEEITVSRFSKEEPDLDTVVVDFEAREEMEDEATPEEVEEMRNTIAGMEMKEAISQEAAKQNFNQPPPEKPEEKKDQIINVRPEIRVDAPIINVKIPEQIDHAKEISDIQKGLEAISDKLDQDIEIED